MNQIVSTPQDAGPFPVALFSDAPALPAGLLGEPMLLRYARVAFKRRWLILAVIAASVILAVLATTFMQRQYTAATRIQIARLGAKVVDIQQVDESPSYDYEFYDTQYKLLEARSLSEAVVKKLRLADNDAFLTGFDDDRSGLEKLDRKQRADLATDLVKGGVTISPVPGSSIVDVKFTSPNADMAAKIANAYAAAFIENNLARRYDASNYAREFLRERLDTVRAKLEDSERKAAEFASRSGLVKVSAGNADGGDLDTATTLSASQLAQASAQLSEARAARVKAEAEYRANSGGDAAARSLQSVALEQLRQQRATLAGELGKQSANFGPEYPAILALRSQIAQLDRAIAVEQSRVFSSVDQQIGDKFRQAQAAEAGLQARVDQLTAKVMGEQKSAIGLGIIKRDVDTSRALYEALLQRYKEIGVAGGVGSNNVSIVDPALVPAGPSSPNLVLNLLFGLIAGTLVAGVVVLVAEHVADALVTPADFQQRLGVPLLGATPLDGTETSVLDDEGTPLAEAYFSVLTSLQFALAEGMPKIVAITSARPGEGKSTSAIALARDLARIGKNVLLIDADMRNPSVHRRLGIVNNRGLADVIVRSAKVEDVVTEVRSGLFVMTVGTKVPNPPEILAGRNFEQVLMQIADGFDHVIVDGPPMLGLADAPLLARAAGATLFVMESRSTKASQARIALGRLRAVNAKLVGAILTKLDATATGYGYGYGYDYKYSGN